jgi:O-Antigen ligase
MPAIASNQFVGSAALAEPAPLAPAALAAPESEARRLALVQPNALVRFAFYFSVFAIPFVRLYLPGTGERLGVIRVVQFLLFCAVLSQPSVCLRWVPTALIWFFGYCVLRIASGLWFTPELWSSWWPTTFEQLQLSLPWVWIAFNLLHFPQVRRKSLWLFGLGCALCALLHNIGLGESAVDNSTIETRTTIFGENANVVGATYAIAMIALIGLGMFKDTKASRRLLLLPMIGVIALGIAKTGSRTAMVLVAVGVLVLLFQARAFASRGRRYSMLFIIGLLLAGAVWQVPTVIERFQDLDPQNIGKENPRARMAPVLYEIFLRSPIYGTGPDRYRFELTRRAMPYMVHEQKTIVAHNLVLLLLVETGIIGLLVFAVGVSKSLSAAWRARRGPAGLLPLALLLPFVLSGIVLGDPSSDHVFWLTIAYALAGAA